MTNYERPQELREGEDREALQSSMIETMDAKTRNASQLQACPPGHHIEPVTWIPEEDGWNPWHAEEYQAGSSIIVDYKIVPDGGE